MILVLVAVRTCFYIKDGVTPSSPNSRSLAAEQVDDAFRTISESTSVDEARAGFVRHNLGFGVSLEAPESWHVLTSNQVSQIGSAADDVYGARPDKQTVFAANSSRDPNDNEAQYRVSFVEKPFDASALRSASPEDLRLGCEDIYNSWIQNPPTPSPIGRPQCSVVMFNGKAALLTSYKRHGQLSSVWNVNIVQIPLDDNGVMITFSNMDGAPAAGEAISHINSSFRF